MDLAGRSLIGATVAAAAVVTALTVPAATAAAVPDTVPCDYANASYTIRDLPHSGGFFSPDSRKLAFANGGQLKIYDIASGKIEKAFTPQGEGPPVTQMLQWTERGIFFTRGAITGGRPTPDEDPNRIAFGQVWLVQPDGSGAKHVELALPPDTEVVEYGVPRISPDGQRVGYTFLVDAAHQAGQPNSGWRVAVADVVYAPDGGIRFAEPRFLTDDTYYNETKDWSGDSNQFVFASTRGEGDDRRALNADAFVVDARDGKVTRHHARPELGGGARPAARRLRPG